MSCRFYDNGLFSDCSVTEKHSYNRDDDTHYTDEDAFLFFIKSVIEQLSSNKISSDMLYDELRKHVLKSNSIDELKDDGVYDHKISDVDVKELTGDRDVDELQELRKNRLNDIRVYHKIEKGMSIETDGEQLDNLNQVIEDSSL